MNKPLTHKLNMKNKEIILKYVENIDGDFSNRTLARKIVSENKGLYPDQSLKEIDSVRSSIRYIRGAIGNQRRSGAILEYVRDEMKPSDYMAQFIDKGDSTAEPVWYLPKEYRKVLLLSDLHTPYHFLPAVDAALNYGFKEGIDCIYLNGDIIDFAKISRWSKDPKMPSVQVEVDLVRSLLEGLCGLGVDVVYKMGNHEDRWNRYLLDNAPELHDLNALQLKEVLGLNELDIELVESRQRAKFGKLNVIHGHEFGQSFFNPVNPARGLFLRAKSSTIAGHNHQTSSHHENDLNNKATACFSTGCLCDLQPDYRPYAFTKWNHGAAIIEVDEDGSFDVDNFRIIDGKIRG